MVKPTPLPEHFVDERLKAHIADAVVLLKLKGERSMLAACLIEHARAPTKLLLLQLLRYQTELYVKLATEYEPGSIPPIVVLVLTNGRKKWNGATRFSELLAHHGATARLALDFETIVVDVASISANALSQNPILSGALLTLKTAMVRSGEKARLIARALGLLASVPLLQRQAASYLARVAPSQVKSVLMAAERQGNSMIPPVLMHWVRRGQRQGRKDGARDAMQKALRGVLRKRFKYVPRSVAERLETADVRKLQRWMLAAVDAKSLEAIF